MDNKVKNDTTGKKVTRRDFVKTAAVAGTVLAAYRMPVRSALARQMGGLVIYNSPNLTLFQTALRGVTGATGIPVAKTDGNRYWRLGTVQRFKPLIGQYTTAVHYAINIQQFQDVLHPALASAGGTVLWGYHPNNVLVGSSSPRHLGGIIVGRRGQPVQITFRNNLPMTPPHILPIDTSIAGANAAHNRVAVHFHGGFVPWISDGGPHDWWTPDGQHGLSFLNNAVLNPKTLLNPGAALNEADYYYPNDQSARFGWYHDHAWGITRLNAYAGIATAYIIRDAFEDFLVASKGLPNYIEAGGPEIPLVIQDKIFFDSANPDTAYPGNQTHGALWYPYLYNPADLGDLPPNPLPPISAVPEMFGDTMLVNGTVFPTVSLEARRYRFRILNACQARFLNLQLLKADLSADGVTIDNGVATNAAGPDFLVIGTEGGFLPKAALVPSNVPFDPASLVNGDISIFPSNPSASLLTAPAERWDLIVNFAGLAGQSFILYNDAPSPFPGGGADTDYYFENPDNALTPDEAKGPCTRVLMRFDIGPAAAADGALGIADNTDLMALAAGNGLTWNDPLLAPVNGDATLPTGVPVRYLTLNEVFDQYGRLIQMVGTNIPPGPGPDYGREYMADPTEVVGAGQTEIWEIANLTGDVHPMHFHLVNTQIINRQYFDAYNGGVPNFGANPPVLPPPTELGWKETVKMYPNTVTRVIMKFILPSVPFQIPDSPRTGGHEYVWHCHILEHEEHDMMRPLIVMEKLSVSPSVGTILSRLGGKITYKVKNAIGNIVVAQTGLPDPNWLTVDTLNSTFTVTVPKNPKMPRPGVTVTFAVTDTSWRPADQRTDTAKLIITNLL